MAAHRSLAEVLREHGYRVTLPREAVWEVLCEAHGHLTAEEVAQKVQRSNPGVHLVSVYRSMALLEDIGLVRESRLGDGASRWELVHPDEHFHVVCRVCGKVTHHVGSLVAQIREHLGGDHGFDVESVELLVSGRCASCVASGEPSAAGPAQERGRQ